MSLNETETDLLVIVVHYAIVSVLLSHLAHAAWLLFTLILFCGQQTFLSHHLGKWVGSQKVE